MPGGGHARRRAPVPHHHGVVPHPYESLSQLRPMLATSSPALPAGQEAWAFEPKWDGVRALAHCAPGDVRVVTRRGRDATPTWPELAGLGDALGTPAVLDGEVVAFEDGRPSFERLQQRMHVADPGAVARARRSVPATFLVFDVLWLDGELLVGRPQRARRELLEGLRIRSGPWQRSPSHEGEGDALLAAARDLGLEGVVAKRLDSVYEPGRRSRSWLKVKVERRQELVVAGWLPGEGGRGGRLGSVVVGYHDPGGALRYAGRVGTGFTEAELARVEGLLRPLATATSPFTPPPPPPPGTRFAEPALVAEVRFTGWTAAGILRHPVYLGLRDDVAPDSVVREPDGTPE